MINDRVVQIFEEIADMLEVLGENVFRVRAYQRAAEVIRGLGEDLEEMHAEDDSAIENIPGIGADLHSKIIEILETGECEMHERLVKKLGTGILEILRVRGIGPKKVKKFRDMLDIDSIEKLRSAAESGALATLPGMGEKSQDAILTALEQMTHLHERIPYSKAKKMADAYIKYMKKAKGLEDISVAGSFRRKAETIGDLDILVTGKDPAALTKHFLSYPKVIQVLAQGETKSSVVINGNMQVDFRVVEPDSFGAALFYFTGPKHYNIHVRTVALKRGMKINEYGLFKGEKKIAGKTEKEMYDALGMEFLTPEERQDFK